VDGELKYFLDSIKKDINDINTKMDSMRDDLTNKINALDVKIDAKTDSLRDDLTNKINALDIKIDAKTESLRDDLTNKINALDIKIDAKTESLRKELNITNASIEHIKNEIREIKNNIGDLNAKVNANQEVLVNVAKMVSDTSKDLRELKETVEDDTKIIQAQLKVNAERLDVHEKRIKKLQQSKGIDFNI